MWGRHSEREVLDQLLEAVRGGASRGLVLRGERGVGKSVLAEYAVESAAGLRVVRAAGVKSEMALPFAVLKQLCAPMLDGLDALPAPQRQALQTAFGLSRGAAPERFLIGLGALGLLSEAARAEPLLCVIEDAQWLDRASAQALGFVARRPPAGSVGIVFALRGARDEFEGLPELTVEGLAGDDARALLDS